MHEINENNSLELLNKEPESEVKNYEIESLEEPMKAMLSQMLPRIENGDYDLIIGIDASGRVPALIMDKIVNYIYEKKGREHHNMRFLAGRVTEEDAEYEIKKWNPVKRVLLVEDTILYGSSIRGITRSLIKLNIKFDIAAISNIENLDKIDAGEIFFGMTNSPSIYSKHQLGGVRKYSGDRFSAPLRTSIEQGKVTEARKDIDIVVQRLINWYEGRNE